MSLVLADRVKESCSSPGTGAVSLLGAATGYQAFSAAVGNGNTTYYTIADQSGANWEVGIGTYSSSGNTLARTAVLSSSNSGSLVNFSSGSQDVWVDYPSEKAVYTDASGNISNLAGSISTVNTVDFNTSYATALTAGQMGWDGNNTFGLGMAGGNVIQRIGEDAYMYVKASSAITKGQLCMFTGVVGASSNITAAPSTGVTNGQYIIGLAAESIALNGFGLIQVTGNLKGFDTSAFADGDILYYDSAVTGGLTATYPTSGPIVTVCAVTHAGTGGSGSAQIRVSVTQRINTTSPLAVSQTTTGTALSLGVVPIADGGTNSTATPTAGGAAYGTGTAYAVTAAGTSGQVLTSNGTSAPTWSNRTQYLGVLLHGGTTTQVPTSNGYIGILLNGGSTTQVPIS